MAMFDITCTADYCQETFGINSWISLENPYKEGQEIYFVECASCSRPMLIKPEQAQLRPGQNVNDEEKARFLAGEWE